MASDGRGDDKGRGEWAQWPLVLTSTIGVSLGTLGTYTAGMFIAPLEAAFGWSRAEVTSGMLIYALIAVPLSPFVGALIDRWGARRLALPGVVLTGLSFAGLALADGSLAQWWLLWGVFGFFTLAVKTTLWSSAVANAFVKHRGLALAVALSGTGVAASISPSLTQYLIETAGWRAAYAAVGLGWSAVTFILVLFFFFDRRPAGQGADGARPEQPGLTFGQAVRSPAFLKLCVAALLINTLLIGLTVHLVPILTAAKLTRGEAAAVAGVIGIASITGKLVSGWLLDRWSGAVVGGVVLLIPTLACLLLLFPQPSALWGSVVAFLIGFASGAILTVVSYLTTRHVGMRAFATNFGVVASVLALTVGVGPLLLGYTYDVTHSYRSVLVAGLFLSALCSALIFSTGKPPRWEEA